MEMKLSDAIITYPDAVWCRIGTHGSTNLFSKQQELPVYIYTFPYLLCIVIFFFISLHLHHSLLYIKV